MSIEIEANSIGQFLQTLLMWVMSILLIFVFGLSVELNGKLHSKKLERIYNEFSIQNIEKE